MSYQDVAARRLGMVMALGLFDLTERDNELLDWLATWPQETTEAVADLLHRARRPVPAR